jgi:soluble lytic murein transglycosylase
MVIRAADLLQGFVAACLGLALAAGAAAGAAAGPDVRQQFMAAMQRVRANQPDLPDSTDLKGYAVYDYLVAARLRRDLALRPGEELDARIDAFLEPRGGEPVGRPLRHDWLESLAARGRWDWFLPRAADVTDPPLVCDRLAGRLATDAVGGLAAEALARWSLPQRPPPECAPVFAWLRAEQLLTPALADARTRAALAAGNAKLARDFAVDEPAALAAPLLQWAQLLDNPRPTLFALSREPTLPVEAEALTAGFERLSRQDSASAFDVLPGLLERPDMTAALQAALRRAAALGAAYDHAAGAVSAFNGVALEPGDAPGQEWRVRAALWARDFPQALGWIQQMPAALAAEPRWRYWRARAVQATAGADAAMPLYAEIAGLRDFYGYLAADRLRTEYRLNESPSPDDEAAQRALATLPALIRARALFDCNLADDATAEWNTVFATAPAGVKIQGAHLASRWGWYAEAIAALAQAGDWDDVRLRYPTPYLEIIAAAATLTRVPVDWILGVMRQESLFRPDAVSRADARGLMQMLPRTAVAVSRRWHLPAPGPDGLFEPAVAVPLGAAYLGELLDRYGGALAESLAAYNAGPGAVARWLPGEAKDADVWIENIPYNETRGYVEHIVEHIVAFAWVRELPPPRLETLLKPVEPAAASALPVTTQ